MITLDIDNAKIENIFLEGFNSNKEKFLAFIESSYLKKEELQAFESDKEQFLATYKSMQKGTVELLTEEEANQEIETYLKTL